MSSQTLSFDEFFGENSYDSSFPGSPGTGLLETTPLTGFSKFDPALGFLTEVRIRLDVDASWDLFGEVDPDADIIDPGAPFTFDFELESFLEAGVFYLPSGSNVLLSAATDEYFDIHRLVFDGDINNTSDSTGDFFGEINFSGSQTSGSLFPGVNDFNPSDFVGTGEVEGLELGFIVPLDDLWFTDNLSSASADLTYSLAPGEVTIEYHYDVIPEPSSVILLGAGLGLLMRRRRA